MTTDRIRHHVSRPLVVALAATCVTVVTIAQQPAQLPAQPDAAARERQAEINRRPDTPGTGRFEEMKEEVA